MLYKKLMLLLIKSERRELPKLLGLMVLSPFLEALSIGFIVPAIGLMTQNDMTDKFPAMTVLLARLGHPGKAYLIAGGMLILVFIYMVKTGFLVYLSKKQNKFSYRVQSTMSVRLFQGYLRQSWAFHLERNSSQLIQNVISETSLFVDHALQPGLVLFSESLVVLGAITLLMIVKPLETLVVTGFFMLSAVIYQRFIHSKSRSWGKERTVQEELRMLHLQEGLRCVKEIKLLGREDYFLKNYQLHSINNVNIKEKHKYIIELPRLLLELIAVIGLAILVVMLLARHELVENVLPILVLFAAVAFRLMPSVNRILSSLNNLQYSRAIVDRLCAEFVHIGHEEENEASAPILFADRIIIKDVSYAYPNTNTSVLRDINLVIPYGSAIGIIGPSGAGKSTLMDIILGLLRPSAGYIAVDGIDISNNLRGWHNQIGYIPQTIHLLDDTIRHNVAFGVAKNCIDEAAVLKAITAAQLDEFVASQALGLDTVIGEDGLRLSGGQRQRIGIARALYHDPALLVLDEATSALDMTIEDEVMRAIYSLQGKKTIIIVTHRLSTIKKCDFVYKISHGTMVKDVVANDLETVGWEI